MKMNPISATVDKVKAGQARIEKGIIELQHLAKETLEQVKRSEQVLRKAAFESTEISTPTCLIILPHKLRAPGDRGDAEVEGGDVMADCLRGMAEVC